MTNAEKYLKDGILYHELACEIALFISNSLKSGLVQNIDDFFKQQAKPQLTEDEKVILRNIDRRYKLICRDNAYNLFVKNGTYDIEKINPLDKLFQFIKERRRIRDRGVIEKMKRTKYIIDKFYKEHEFETYDNRVELQNELSAFLLVNKLDDITDNEYLKIEAELNHIYLSGRSEHF